MRDNMIPAPCSFAKRTGWKMNGWCASYVEVVMAWSDRCTSCCERRNGICICQCLTQCRGACAKKGKKIGINRWRWLPVRIVHQCRCTKFVCFQYRIACRIRKHFLLKTDVMKPMLHDDVDGGDSVAKRSKEKLNYEIVERDESISAYGKGHNHVILDNQSQWWLDEWGWSTNVE